VKNKLYEFNCRGHKDVLKKRLKNYLKNRKLIQAKVCRRTEPLYDYYIVIDFEATCNEYNPEGFRHEIIEFPVVLIDARTITVVSGTIIL
jgi:3'-5' exoribonuclease 1